MVRCSLLDVRSLLLAFDRFRFRLGNYPGGSLGSRERVLSLVCRCDQCRSGLPFFCALSLFEFQRHSGRSIPHSRSHFFYLLGSTVCLSAHQSSAESRNHKIMWSPQNHPRASECELSRQYSYSHWFDPSTPEESHHHAVNGSRRKRISE